MAWFFTEWGGLSIASFFKTMESEMSGMVFLVLGDMRAVKFFNRAPGLELG